MEHYFGFLPDRAGEAMGRYVHPRAATTATVDTEQRGALARSETQIVMGSNPKAGAMLLGIDGGGGGGPGGWT